MGLFKRNKVWYCSITPPDGQRIRKALSRDRRAAEILYGKIQEAIALQKLGIGPKAIPLPEKPQSLMEIVRKFMDAAKTKRRSQAYFISFDRAWRDIVEAGRVKTLDAITTEYLETWVRAKLAAGLKPQTINQRLALFRPFCRWAVAQGIMTKNPLENWEQLPAAKKAYRRDLQPDEIRRIIAAEESPEFRLRWRVYVLTALRRAAGAELAWDWVDFNEKIINLPVESNKSQRAHRIPLHPGLEQELRVWQESTGRSAGAVFPVRPPDTILYRFLQTCKKAGVDTKGVCLHSLRHSAASMIYEATGRNLKATQEILGHAGINTTAMYLHVADEEKRRAIDSIDFF